jgi:hypothetical protein
MSVVAYSESEIAAVDGTLSALPFVNAVFPYGFAATSTISSASSRTIASEASGRLLMGFNAAGLTRVVWRAVAVVDDRVRIASPQIYNYRDKVDGFAEYLALAQGIGNSNPAAGKVQAVVLGTMVQGDRLLPAPYTCATFDFIELGDVRLAGGYGSSSPHFWIGGATANTAVTKVTAGTTACVP